MSIVRKSVSYLQYSVWIELDLFIVIDVCFPFDHRSKTERVINELSYAISRLTRESEITAECTGEPQKVEIKMEEFLQFPILSEQVDGDLQVIEEILQMRHEEVCTSLQKFCHYYCIVEKTKHLLVIYADLWFGTVEHVWVMQSRDEI